MSARLPGVRLPTSSSRPSARAASRVARRSAAVASSASGRRSRARLHETAVRSSSQASNDGVEAGESVPSPTRTPAARRPASGAMPQPSSAFERGQCATGTSARASSCDLVVVDVDAVRAEKLGAEHVLERRRRCAAPVGSTRTVAVAVERPGAVLEPLVLGRALGEVRPDRDAEREAPAVDVDRAGVGRVRRDPDPHELALGDAAAQLRRSRARSAPGRCRRPRGRRSRAARARTPRRRTAPEKL